MLNESAALNNKTGIETNISGLNLKISPKLTVDLKIEGINAKNNTKHPEYQQLQPKIQFKKQFNLLQ